MSSPSRAARRHPERHAEPEPQFPQTAIAWMHPGDTSGAFTNLVVDLMAYDGVRQQIHRHAGTIRMETSPRLAAARCQIVREFLKMPPSIEYLMFLDADMSGEGDSIYKLLRTAVQEDAGIVGGLCFVGGRGTTGMNPTIYALSEDPIKRAKLSVDRYEHYPMNARVQCDATGGAAMLIRRDVLEKVGQRYGRFSDGSVNPTPWFTDGIHQGQEFGEDVAFCIRARLCGFKVVVDTGVKFGHQKTYELTEELYRLHLLLHGKPDLKDAADVEGVPDGLFDISGPIVNLDAPPQVSVQEPEPDPALHGVGTVEKMDDPYEAATA